MALRWAGGKSLVKAGTTCFKMDSMQPGETGEKTHRHLVPILQSHLQLALNVEVKPVLALTETV